MLGSSASVAFIRDEIMSGHVTDTEADIWLTSMAFIANPTKNIFDHVKVSIVIYTKSTI
jgi:translation elongation factor EF-Ts